MTTLEENFHFHLEVFYFFKK